MDFTELFVSVDEFWVKFRPSFEKSLLEDGRRRRLGPLSLCPSEIMTLLIAFQTSHYRTFKHFYLYLLRNHRRDFPGLVSYQRFVEWIPSVTVPLFTYLINHGLGPVTGISFIDSTALAVCSNKRIRRHRVFRGLAQVGKTTLGWFYGFKLHLIINDRGDLLAFHLTPGNGDDRQVVTSPAAAGSVKPRPSACCNAIPAANASPNAKAPSSTAAICLPRRSSPSWPTCKKG